MSNRPGNGGGQSKEISLLAPTIISYPKNNIKRDLPL